MTYKKYSSYKPSGIEWIGDIPSHWSFIKTNIITKNLDGKRIPLNSEERGKMEGKYPYWGSNGIVDYVDKFLFNEEIVLVGEDGSPFFDKLKDVSFYVNEPVWVNNHIHILKPTNRILPKFLTHSFNCVDYKEYITGSTRDKLTQSDLKRISHCVPPLPEQQQIVNYLDEKTTIIDKLTSNKQRKVELLKEQRTTLINQVITKGLNPNVKMKDSGVEWIGEIPEGWEVRKLKSLVECNKKVLPENTNPDYELKYIEIGDVNSLGEIKDMTDYLFKDSPSRCRRILNKGDIFISSVRTYLKSIGYVENEISDVICSTGFCVLTPKTDIISKFLFYQVLTEFFIGEVISKSVGVSYPSITSTELVNIKVIKPSLIEQQKIVEYLDKHTKEIDDLVSMEQIKIELLKEYRQSLISEVITGKIKVIN
jgi:type I restriction enzyme S subunit